MQSMRGRQALPENYFLTNGLALRHIKHWVHGSRFQKMSATLQEAGCTQDGLVVK